MIPRYKVVEVELSGLVFRHPWSAESREMWLYRLEQMIAKALRDAG
jgi:hypothetical protein